MTDLIAPQLHNIFTDNKISHEDKILIKTFHDAAAKRIQNIFSSEYHQQLLICTVSGKELPYCETFNILQNISTIQSLYQDVLDDIRLSKKALKKGEDSIINALYVCLLDLLKLKLSNSDLKYPTKDSFLRVYGEKFQFESEREKTLLWETANWMAVLFKMTTARKNTGLTIQVIPKVVEDWTGMKKDSIFWFFVIDKFYALVKYITGSGMKKSTANRVFLFHSEGGTPINRRGKLRTQKEGTELTSVVSDEENESEAKSITTVKIEGPTEKSGEKNTERDHSEVKKVKKQKLTNLINDDNVAHPLMVLSSAASSASVSASSAFPAASVTVSTTTLDSLLAVAAQAYNEEHHTHQTLPPRPLTMQPTLPTLPYFPPHPSISNSSANSSANSSRSSGEPALAGSYSKPALYHRMVTFDSGLAGSRSFPLKPAQSSVPNNNVPFTFKRSLHSLDLPSGADQPFPKGGLGGSRLDKDKERHFGFPFTVYNASPAEPRKGESAKK